MTTYPLFVPAGDDHVATVLTVPSSEPDGLVVVLAGTGRHNVVGGTMAGLLSARLAQAGLASVRLDYAGVGDSSGEVETWSPSDLEAALTQAQATVRTAREVLGIDRYAAVGTCYGSRVALSLVGDPACAGAVCLAPPILDPGAMRRAGRRLEGGSILGAIRSSPLGRKLVLGPARRLASLPEGLWTRRRCPLPARRREARLSLRRQEPRRRPPEPARPRDPRSASRSAPSRAA